jgi:hypothetical protein
MKQFAQNVTRMLRSQRFFVGAMVFFVFESLWIAFSARYPQAFDEQFHFGLIRFYSHHWSPFITNAPPSTYSFGAIVRDPSYFYHYLMSFPYRLIALFVHAQAAQVIILRLIDVLFFGFGLHVFYKLLLRAKISRPLANVSIWIMVLIPIVPQLAAQINYDDLVFPLVALTCWLTFDVYDALREKRVDVRNVLLLLSLCLLSSIVKYAYLPIFVAVCVFVLGSAWYVFRKELKDLWRAFAEGFFKLSKMLRVGLLALVLLSAGLFSQRYVVNMIDYHNPVPDCGQVLTVKDCLNYGPWNRNYNDAQKKSVAAPKNPIKFTGEWFFGMYYRLFFAINGNYANYFPLPVPSLAAIILTFSAAFVLALEWRRVLRGNAFLVFFLLVSVFYCGALWLDNYKDYVSTGQPVAINGRYLLPVLLPFSAVLGRAFSLALRRRSLRVAKPIVAFAVLVMFVAGGGIFTFISRSDSSWYWPNSVVVHVNNAAHHALSPILIEHGGKYY